LLGLEGAEHHLHAQILKAQTALKPFDEGAIFLSELATFIEQRQH
jgi:geranylgeranyl diphosphate synthase type II